MRLPFARVVAAAALALVACSKAPAPISSEPREDGGLPLDTEVMAYLSEARALHHQANLREDARDLPGAIAPLERLAKARRPHKGAVIPEVEEVLADTLAREAELLLRSGDLSGAEVAIRAGLTHAPDPTYFRGHLLEISGVIDETYASTLADAGKAGEAEQARARARDLLNQAVTIQEQVLAHTTETDGGHR
jgi:hypothetical protein